MATVYYFVLAVNSEIPKLLKVFLFRSFKLSPIAYQDSAQAGKYHVIAVLSSSNTNIKSWKDLRQRRACFPEFGGLGRFLV